MGDDPLASRRFLGAEADERELPSPRLAAGLIWMLIAPTIGRTVVSLGGSPRMDTASTQHARHSAARR